MWYGGVNKELRGEGVPQVVKEKETAWELWDSCSTFKSAWISQDKLYCAASKMWGLLFFLRVANPSQRQFADCNTHPRPP